MLVLLSSRSTDLQIRTAGERAARAVETAGAERHERVEQLRKQVERQDDADFWDTVMTIGQVVAIAASVVAACFSGGSALVITAALVSAAWTAGNLATDGQLLQKMGIKLDEDYAPWVNLGITVALTVATCGAAALSSGTQAVGAAGQAAAGASRTAGAAAQAGSTTGRAVSLGVEVAGAGMEVGGGYGKAVSTADALEHGADAELASARVQEARAERSEAVDTMRRVSELERRIVDLALEIEESKKKAAQAAMRRA
jgi:hypothetical protein